MCIIILFSIVPQGYSLGKFTVGRSQGIKLIVNLEWLYSRPNINTSIVITTNN